MPHASVRSSVAFLVSSFALLFLFAADASAFTVSPVIVDIGVEPGKSTQGALTVMNDGERTRTYYVSVQKFVAQGEEGHQEFLPEEDRTGLASWIVPQAKSITLGPKESAEFTYAVVVPEGAEPGGHYAALFFSSLPETLDEDSSVGMGAKTGVLFLLKVPGDIKEDARVESFRLMNDGKVLNHLPAYFDLRVRNLGNVHFRPEGSIVVRNLFGSVTARISANPRGSRVLPNSVRRVDAAWANTFEIEEGDGFVTGLKNEWRNFAIGRYTADLDVVYGAGHQPLRGSVSFWVFPWRILLVFAIALGLLILFLKLYNRMVVRTALKQVGKKKS
ncbi:hypothetical protein L0Y59_02775 [Candidatus Uhrbacteria bacterium]|nr:hypothetical protein [Candidatus Uhrbacteria bacterium]